MKIVKSVRIGVAGLGTVGSSVVDILMNRRAEIERRANCKFILSKVITRTKTKYELLGVDESLIAEDFEDLIINSDVVIETIGGFGPALDLVKKALNMGKLVITANKDMISEYGNLLLELANENGTKIFFEASVGGGIPIITFLQDYLISQNVKKIRGILNGTTNFILTKMINNMDFKSALKLAQDYGYAEADPSKDIEGYDTAYKISVLYGVVKGRFPGISCMKIEGISHVRIEDVMDAYENGKKLKLVGSIDFERDEMKVELMELERDDPLWNVDGVENAVMVETDLAGSFLLRSRGAGGYPTATAIISDILRASNYMSTKEYEKRRVIVMKFGGTSLETIDKIKKVAERVKGRKLEGFNPVVVVSAMGDTTDRLLDMAKKVNMNPSPREIDMLISTGEQQSSALMSMALQSLGVNAISFTGDQLKIMTDGTHTNARIIGIMGERIHEMIEKDYVPVVTGFRGVSPSGDITTLGRGGSDMTAVALAHYLGLKICEIYTDVEGVYTADPKVVPSAKPIRELSWEEMIELSSQGAQVMQIRAVEFARRYGIKILVKNAHKESPGTLIWEGTGMEGPLVRAVTFDEKVVKVVLRKVPDRPGIAARVLRALADQNIKIDTIIQSMRSGKVNDMAFIIPSGDLEKIDLERLKIRSEAEDIIVEDNIAKLSLVGINVTSSPEIPAILFETLASEGINIDMISTSNSRISVIISRDSIKEAVRIVHDRFNLG